MNVAERIACPEWREIENFRCAGGIGKNIAISDGLTRD
jgi:hypothetical protein